MKTAPCRVDDCTSNVVVALGLCDKHYRRFRKTGSTQKPVRISPPCTITDCYELVEGLGLCRKHYMRLKRRGDPEAPAQPRTGKSNPFWAGDDVSYDGAHGRVKRARGLPSSHQCCDCGQQSEEWSYNNSDPNEKFQPGKGAYSLDVSRYEPRCRPCHRSFDTFHRRQTQQTSVLV